MNDKFLTKSEFSKLVEKTVLDNKMAHMDAVLKIRLNLIPGRTNELNFD